MDEYEILADAFELQMLDEIFKEHRQAFLNYSVQAQKKNGRPVYRKFRNFFDYDKELRKIQDKKSGGKPRFFGVGKFLNRKEEK